MVVAGGMNQGSGLRLVPLAFQVIVTFAGAPAWVTDIVRVSPPPVTVIAPVRFPVPGLATALIRNEPLPVRLAGAILLIVSQPTLLVGVHVMLDVTWTVIFPAPCPGAHVLCDTVSVAGNVLT